MNGYTIAGVKVNFKLKKDQHFMDIFRNKIYTVLLPGPDLWANVVNHLNIALFAFLRQDEAAC